MTIHDPDVVLTDLGLALLGGYLGWRLWTSRDRSRLAAHGAIILWALASAAFWGAVFHAFFPAGTRTPSGFLAWVPVVLSIVVVAGALLDLGLRVSAPRLPARGRQAIVTAYAAAFAAVTLLIDSSYGVIVRFYSPVLVLFLLAASVQAARTRSRGWTLIAISFALSLVAGVLQQARIALHPEYFDHNAVYHVVQGAALVVMYRGFRAAPAASVAAR